MTNRQATLSPEVTMSFRDGPARFNCHHCRFLTRTFSGLDVRLINQDAFSSASWNRSTGASLLPLFPAGGISTTVSASDDSIAVITGAVPFLRRQHDDLNTRKPAHLSDSSGASTRELVALAND